MSIGSIASNVWTPPVPPQSGLGSASGTFSATSSTNTTASGTGTSTTGSTDPFQQLATDIPPDLHVLVEMQSGNNAIEADAFG